VSVVFHGILAVGLAFYILVEERALSILFTADVAPPTLASRARSRPRIAREVPRPAVVKLVVDAPKPVHPTALRVTTRASIGSPSVRCLTRIEVRPRPTDVEGPVSRVASRVATPKIGAPQVLRATDLTASVSPIAAIRIQPPGGPTVRGGPAIGRGGVIYRPAVTRVDSPKLAGISLVEHVGAELVRSR
jgi:hypothetical protein